MGRKLTSYEKSSREREKERERQARAEAVEHRRKEERETKKDQLDLRIKNSERIVKKWEELYQNINNLPKKAYELYNSKSNILDFIRPLNQCKILEFKRSIRFIELTSKYEANSFIESEKLKELRELSELTIYEYSEKFKKRYIPFLDFILQVKKSYSKYIENANRRLEEKTIQEQDRKMKFYFFLENYNNLFKSDIEKFKNDFDNKEDDIRNKYESYISKKIPIVERSKEIIKWIRDNPFDLDSLVYMQIILGIFPIKYQLEFNASIDEDDLGLTEMIRGAKSKKERDELNEYTIELSRIIKSNRYIKSDPSRLKVGIRSHMSKRYEIFIELEKDHFPLHDIQLVMLKERHSERPLTKKHIEDIDKNYFSGLVLSYAYFMFKFTSIDIVDIFLLHKLPDASTGNEIFQLKSGHRAVRNNIKNIKFEHIIPSEAIKNFEMIEMPKDFENIFWCKKFYKNKYTIDNDVLNYILSNSDVDYLREFSEKGKFICQLSNELRDLEKQLSELIIDKEDFIYNSMHHNNDSIIQPEKLDLIFEQAQNKELKDAYNKWKTDSDRMVNTAREMLKKNGKDPKVLDEIAKKYRNF